MVHLRFTLEDAASMDWPQGSCLSPRVCGLSASLDYVHVIRSYHHAIWLPLCITDMLILSLMQYCLRVKDQRHSLLSSYLVPCTQRFLQKSEYCVVLMIYYIIYYISLCKFVMKRDILKSFHKLWKPFSLLLFWRLVAHLLLTFVRYATIKQQIQW